MASSKKDGCKSGLLVGIFMMCGIQFFNAQTAQNLEIMEQESFAELLGNFDCPDRVSTRIQSWRPVTKQQESENICGLTTAMKRHEYVWKKVEESLPDCDATDVRYHAEHASTNARFRGHTDFK